MSIEVKLELPMSQAGIDALLRDLRGHGWGTTARQIEEQLPKPIPPEPKGLGAVVRDDDGNYFVRHTQGSVAPWIAVAPRDSDRPYRYWDGIRNPVVVGIGVDALEGAS